MFFTANYDLKKQQLKDSLHAFPPEIATVFFHWMELAKVRSLVLF